MKIVTMINFREHISIANVTRWWGAWSTCARARALVRHLCRKKTNPLFNLVFAISTILAQGNA